MKKIILGSIAVVAIAAIAAFNVNLNNSQSENLSAMTMANVEALAQGEGSNNSGTGNMYFYEHKLGDPKTCTIYKSVNVNGSVQYSDSNVNLGAGWTTVSVNGIVESCPKSGSGCTVYSCHETNNTH